jgi:DNA-binding transcriptional MerR regulator
MAVLVTSVEGATPATAVSPGRVEIDTLVLASGTSAGQRFELSNEITTVGRHAASDVFLDDVSVSRHHGVFTRTASGRVTVRDLNSLNGTYVNGSRVDETVLHHNDEVLIGKFKLIYWAPESSAAAKLRIGEVHALLRHDFPDIELSKIRYYEDKGLVQPARSKKGYRLYSERDVACLREAFRLASQEYVPLRVIRERLIDQGLLRPSETAGAPAPRAAAREATVKVVSLHVPPRPAAAEIASTSDVNESAATVAPLAPSPVAVSDPPTPEGAKEQRLSRVEFLSHCRISEAELRELLDYNFVSPNVVAGVEVYATDDVDVARRFRSLADRGVDVRHLAVLRRVVERERDLVDDITSPLKHHRGLSDSERRDEVEAVRLEVAALRQALGDSLRQRHGN